MRDSAQRVLTRLLEKTLPRRNLGFAVGYGSGAFPQPPARAPGPRRELASEAEPEARGPVLDMMMVVGGGDAGQDREAATNMLASWHNENILRNPSHYGGILAMGRSGAPRRLASTASGIGCGIHFVAPFDIDHGVDESGTKRCKYGILDIHEAVTDLTDWRTLAFAGRMQKPTLGLLQGDKRLMDAQTTNLRAAMATAVLLLPEEFNQDQLFRTIVGLSYGGDLRMVLGAERADKVSAIAEGSRDGMESLYASHIRDFLRTTSSAGCSPVYCRAASIHELLWHVPNRPLHECAAAILRSTVPRSTDADARNSIVRGLIEHGGGDTAWRHDGPVAQRLRGALRSIVFETSVRMAIYGLMTTDIASAAAYAYAKACKGQKT